jgi:AAHS family 4-hydroxybenzoate transporter-like MFS transporter
MSEATTVDVTQIIEGRALGARQIAIIALCAAVAFLDGMNLQSIGLAAPGMISTLHVAPQAFGAVFSAALVGIAIGSFALGPVADRFGSKRVLIASTLCFGVFTIGTALVGNLDQLIAYRVLAGLGLGGAMPSYISLASDYVPGRLRATVVSAMWAGFPLGGTIGGIVASWIIPVFGWQSVFYVGGMLPFLLLVPLAMLPESVTYLTEHANPVRIARTLQRVFPDTVFDSSARFTLTGGAKSKATPIQLFLGGRASGTLLLWISFFLAFMVLVTNSAWSPTLLHSEGMPVMRSAIALAVFNFGSIFGSGFAGWLVARFGATLILPVTFLLSAISYGLIGYVAPSMAMVTLFQGLFGLFAGCASSGLIALAAVFYPAATRSTGVGWAMAVGRCGSFVGPLWVSALLGAHWSVEYIFATLAASILLGAFASLAIGLREQRAPT